MIFTSAIWLFLARIFLQPSLTLDPWADSKKRSTLEFHNLHHGSIGVHNWGSYFLDPLGVLDLGELPEFRSPIS